jgi:heat shock protein HslJ
MYVGFVAGFGSDADRFSFWGGCNPHGTDYLLCGDRLCIAGWSRTDFGCGAEIAAQDDWLAESFRTQPALTLDGDVLTFTGPDAVLVFRCDDSAEGRECPQ